ncbi:MAG: 3-oxoacyl-ACP synthase [Pseudomonadota bacterium]|nr:3-oxoacyl-ACP synthase [Pseudomonadota bacterium]
MTEPIWASRGEIAVLGMGRALPGDPIGTQELVDRLADRFGFRASRQALAVAGRLGIETRHLCRAFEARDEAALPGRSNPDLAASAISRALAQAGLTIRDIGYMIGHTTTPEQPLPANIAFVADRLGYAGPQIEVRQACTGFANALMIAFGLLAAPDAGPVVIVGSETGSLFFDPARADEDSGQLVNMVQMGDGAGAIILAPAGAGADTISGAWFGSIGLGRSPGIEMAADGRREFRHHFAAIRASGGDLFDVATRAAVRQGAVLTEMDVIIPHQVSGRIGAHCAAHFGLPVERFFVNADAIGNTGSAAIWLALAAWREREPVSGSRTLILGAEASKYMHGGFVYAQR